ncbi:diacylglycerol kinase [Colwellia sp. 1_MG-2023]|uniref:diacylglycerol kinase n=1 Tax=Colwellia sp. 1_MG-2023 TaxID=3062649 RepID=UPI0026E3935B|nr:diacylglycerol kinase [Colwellia sp. 1_MG-2023]MDO6444708.1 diacylglycerol kinase [Colwellia sp. 1_MG-2023]
MFDNKNKPKGLKRVYLATLNSTRAFKWLLDNEAAFRQELMLLACSIALTCLFNITFKEQLILIISILFIIFTEVLNTAIEAIVDRIGLEIHPLSGLAKDLGSAAVLISILICSGVWVIILL